jgi:hypothetical protein
VLWAIGFDNAICRFAVADIGKEESWDDLRGEKESNMDPVLERKSEECVRANLDGRNMLDLFYHPRRLKNADIPALEVRLQALSGCRRAASAWVRRCPSLRLGWCLEAG